MGIPHRSFFEWTDERCDLLRALHAAGVSSSAIAAKLGGGVTRNAVIGKAARLRLTKPGRTHNGTYSYRNQAASKPEPLHRTTRIIPAHMNGALRLVDVCEPDHRNACELPADDIPIMQRKTVLSAGENDCRWPYGDPGTPNFFFCGDTKANGSSYCTTHARIAFSASRYRNVPDDEHMRRSASALRVFAAKATRL